MYIMLLYLLSVLEDIYLGTQNFTICTLCADTYMHAHTTKQHLPTVCPKRLLTPITKPSANSSGP